MAGRTNKRVFQRLTQDGRRETVEMAWDSENPTETFAVDAAGFKGKGCVEALANVEKLIGPGSMTAKPEMYQGEDPQNVFIVGSN